MRNYARNRKKDRLRYTTQTFRIPHSTKALLPLVAKKHGLSVQQFARRVLVEAVKNS